MSFEICGYLLMGGLLVSIGFILGAFVERLRSPRSQTATGRTSVGRHPTTNRDASNAEQRVAAALTAAGYPRKHAVAAVAACAEPERRSVERWTRAALALCAQGVGA